MEQGTTTGSEQYSYLTCLHTSKFMLLRVFSLIETICLKISAETNNLACEMFSSEVRLWFKKTKFASFPFKPFENINKWSLLEEC